MHFLWLRKRSNSCKLFKVVKNIHKRWFQSIFEAITVIHVFEILSNFGHIFKVCLEYVQRVYSECVQSVFRVCSEFVQSVFGLCSECVRSVFGVSSECHHSAFVAIYALFKG